MSTAYNGTKSIQYTFNQLTYITPWRTELGGAVIRISVRISVQVNVDVIIVISILMLVWSFILYISTYFRVFDSMLFNFDI